MLAADHTAGSSLVYAAVGRPYYGEGMPNNYRLLNVFKTTNGTDWVTTDPPDFVVNDGADYRMAIALSPTGRVYVGSLGINQVTPFGQKYGVLASNVRATAWRPIDIGTNGIYLHVAPITKTVGASPWAVATGHFDGDNQLDLAVANFSSNTLSVILRGPGGSFQVATDYNVGSGPIAIVTGNFNNDAHLDLAVANNSSHTVTILPGQGDGTFGAPVVTAAGGNNPRALAAGDFDQDGKPDLTVANASSQQVRILRGNNDGTFALGNAYNVGQLPAALAVGHFDGDNDLDLAVVNRGTHNVHVFRGADGVTFQLHDTEIVGTNPTAVGVGDFDGDNRADLVVAIARSHVVRFLKGDGSGGFEVLGALPPVGKFPDALAVGDLNGDGQLDVVTANRDADAGATPPKFAENVSVLYGKGDGTFDASLRYELRKQHDTALTSTAVALGEFNADGRLDVAVANWSGGNVSVLLSNTRVSQTGRGTWDNLNTPSLKTHMLNAIAVHPTNPDVLMVGSQDNGTARTVDGGTMWPTIDRGDAGMLRFDPNDGHIAYKTVTHKHFHRSQNGGARGTWEYKPAPEDAYPFYPVFAISRSDSKRLVFGSNTKVYQTQNRGDSWDVIGTFVTGGAITALAYHPSNTNIIYAGFQNGQIYRTTNGGGDGSPNNWSGDFLPPQVGQPVASIVAHRDNANVAYAALRAFAAGPVWRRREDGTGWNNISGGLPGQPDTALPNLPARAIVHDPDPRRNAMGVILDPSVYVGTDVGVYAGYTQDGISWRWERFGDGLPNVQVVDLHLGVYGDRKLLWAATHGRGAWSIVVLLEEEVEPPPDARGGQSGLLAAADAADEGGTQAPELADGSTGNVPGQPPSGPGGFAGKQATDPVIALLAKPPVRAGVGFDGLALAGLGADVFPALGKDKHRRGRL